MPVTRKVINQALQDRPVPIDSAPDDPTRFSIIRDNVEILWKRVNDLRKKPFVAGSGGGSSAASAPASTGGGSTPSGDEFRHFSSLIDFKYDSYDLTWDANKNVVSIVYNLGGNPVSTITITYNSLNQPITMSATHTSETIAFTYDSDDYLDTMVRT